MNDSKYTSLIVWGLIFLFIEVVSMFFYFNFSRQKMGGLDQLAQIFTTKPEEQNNFPVLKQTQPEPALSAEAYISVFAADNGAEKILVEKNKGEPLPIASISKLMTALVAAEKYRLDDIITITDNSLKVDSLSGIYKAGDRFFFYNALRAMLIASHNEIADTLAEQAGKETFITSMNQKAAELGLLNTGFVNATGLDPVPADGPINHSTVYDIYKLAKYISEDRPDILYITTQKEFSLFDLNKNLTGVIKNTDKLLEEQNIPFNVIGGKTGETDLAKQNLIIISEAPCGGKIFSVVLGSQNRFEDMKTLLQYINTSYGWDCLNL